MNQPPRGPTSQQRTIVIGRTGSGKSQFSIALLGAQNWHEMPWVIIDYKGEDLLLDILQATGGLKGGAVHRLYPDDEPPWKPGLYYMHPKPKDDDDLMEAFLWKCHSKKRGPMFRQHRGYIGLFIDEGYCLPQRSAFDVILTQGRTLHIPVICLYQRPVWMSRFAVAQSDFRAHFVEDDDRDLKTSKQFFKPIALNDGSEINVGTALPPYWCLWYDVSRGQSSVLRPAPDRQTIIDHFKARLNVRKQRALI